MENIQGGYLIVSLEDDNIFEELGEIVSRETKPILIKGITEYDTKDCFISVTDIIATKDENDEVLYYTLPVSGVYKKDAYCIKMAYVYPTVYTVKECQIQNENTKEIVITKETITSEVIKEIVEAKDNGQDIIVKVEDKNPIKVNNEDINIIDETVILPTETIVNDDGTFSQKALQITNITYTTFNVSNEINIREPLYYYQDKYGVMNFGYQNPWSNLKEYSPKAINLSNGFSNDNTNGFTYLDLERILYANMKGRIQDNVLGPTSIFKILYNTDRVELKSNKHFYHLFPFESVSYTTTGGSSSEVMKLKHYAGILPISEESSYDYISSITEASYYSFYRHTPYHSDLKIFIPIYNLNYRNLITTFDRELRFIKITYTIDNSSKSILLPIRMYGFDKGIDTTDSKYYSAGYTWNELCVRDELTIALVNTIPIDLAPDITVGEETTISKGFTDIDGTNAFIFNTTPNVVNFTYNGAKFKMYEDDNIHICNGRGYYITLNYKLDVNYSTDNVIEATIKRLF